MLSTLWSKVEFLNNQEVCKLEKLFDLWAIYEKCRNTKKSESDVVPQPEMFCCNIDQKEKEDIWVSEVFNKNMFEV